ncbi:hypothetical protein D3C76_386860 [compost metagenome]
MRHLLLIPALLLSLPVSSVMADVDAEDVATSAGVSASLYSTFKDDKVVMGTRDDLSSFIASDGAIRGAYLESVLQQVRNDHPGLKASDEELAKALLTQDSRLAQH